MSNKKTVRVISDLVTFKITSEETGGAYSLFETQTPPQGGVPPHIEHREEEAFFVLEGEYTFTHGDQRLTLGPGENLFVKRGIPHSFTNSGDTMARMLITTSPGGLHEQFFNEVGVPVDQVPAGPPDFGKIVASGMKYGIEILPGHLSSEVGNKLSEQIPEEPHSHLISNLQSPISNLQSPVSAAA